MSQRSKSFFMKLAVIVMTFCCMIGAWFSFSVVGNEKTVVKAETLTVEKVDVTDTVNITNSSYGENQSQFIIKLNPASTLTSNAWWNISGDSLTAANNGVDIMNYIYINGENIRTLSDNNRTSNTYPVDTASGWLTNSDQCR
ncbi:MAG: hypothetical protein IKD47_02060, partial [Clostridia bacterium]|nr:hypothetical protein [Clostridia bacterium]